MGSRGEARRLRRRGHGARLAHIGSYSLDQAVVPGTWDRGFRHDPLAGCYGSGKVCELAEIVAATALGGELSLGSAIVAGEWGGARERLGRSRPVTRLQQRKEASWTG